MPTLQALHATSGCGHASRVATLTLSLVRATPSLPSSPSLCSRPQPAHQGAVSALTPLDNNPPHNHLTPTAPSSNLAPEIRTAGYRPAPPPSPPLLAGRPEPAKTGPAFKVPNSPSDRGEARQSEARRSLSHRGPLPSGPEATQIMILRRAVTLFHRCLSVCRPPGPDFLTIFLGVDAASGEGLGRAGPDLEACPSPALPARVRPRAPLTRDAPGSAEVA